MVILVDLKADRTLKLKFYKLSLHTFWLSAREEYPVIPFSTTYLGELGFLTLTQISTSKREQLKPLTKK
jgi:hypothetical protein